MEALLDPAGLVALFTLLALELVLGIDNVIFISILSGKLPEHQRDKARIIGLSLAVISRIILLLSISWIVSLTEPWITLFGRGFSGRDVILLVGGLFLIAKSTHEIHQKLESHEETTTTKLSAKFGNVIFQILLLDIVFSLDSVITAVGMVDKVSIMITAVVIATGIMIFLAKPISDFVERHPTLKMLALSFLLLIGVTLIAESFGQHVSKGYIYFAMGFSLFVEVLNVRLRKKRDPIHLKTGI